MTALTITIPDAVAARVIDGICGELGYQATINGQPNPQTKAQFAKAALVLYAKRLVQQWEAAQADVAARARVESEIALT